MSQEQERMTVLQTVLSIITSPQFLIFGSAFGVMLYGVLTNQVIYAIGGFIIVPIGVMLYVAISNSGDFSLD